MRVKLLTAMVLVIVAIAAATPVVAAQCSQCRESAAAAADGGRSMNFAIVVLLVPTLLMFVGLFVFAMSRRDALGVKRQPSAVADHPSLLRNPS